MFCISIGQNLVPGPPLDEVSLRNGSILGNKNNNNKKQSIFGEEVSAFHLYHVAQF